MCRVDVEGGGRVWKGGWLQCGRFVGRLVLVKTGGNGLLLDACFECV